MFKKKIFELYKTIGLNTNEASAEISMILDYLNIDKKREITDGFSDEERRKIAEIVDKRVKTNCPLQYITGFAYFMGEKYFVDKNTLIPRPETEILVKACSKLVNKNSKVLDIGTGTGCIAIEIAKITNAKVDAIDISENALKIAQKNAKLHNVKCIFLKSDLFSNVKDKYDLIVSNPPYIPIKDIYKLSDVVKNYEPHDALFANDEYGIEFYEKIIKTSVTFLNNNGFLCFEIGINQTDIVSKILATKGFSEIKIIRDLNNIERVTIAKHF